MPNQTNKILLIVCAVLLVAVVALSLTLVMMTALSPDIHLFASSTSTETEDRSDDTEEDTSEEALPVGKGENTHTGKRVAITFDDGPHNVRTKRVVDELAKYGFHATFFVLGNRIDGTEYNGSSAIEYIEENGNEIAIHGYTHQVYYDDCSKAEFEKELSWTEEAILDVLPDYEATLMRPIGGAITDGRVKDCPYSVIMWNVDSLDYENEYKSSDTEEERQAKLDTVVDNVMSDIEDGDIILMHDIWQVTGDALEIILKRLHEDGYEVVTVSELLGDPRPGVKYSHGN